MAEPEQSSHIPSTLPSSFFDVGMPICAICKVDDLRPDELFKLDCEHYYCNSCLPIWLDFACKNESNWPARCCQKEVDLERASQKVQPWLQKKLAEKAIEFSIKDRVYCSNAQCVTFLGAADDSEPRMTVSCPLLCGRDTCMKCKQAAHDGNCIKNQVPPELAALAKEMNWQSCPCCHQMVEMTHGCNKIECYCSTLFCYICQKIWRNCSCKKWVSRQLYLHATRIFLRDPGKDSIQNIVSRLQDATDCDHVGLRRIDIPGVCDICGDDLDVYLERGCNCGLEVCLWCMTGRMWLHKNATAPPYQEKGYRTYQYRKLLRKFFDLFTKTDKKQSSKKKAHIYDPRLKRLREEADEARAIFKKKQDQLMEEWGFMDGTEGMSTRDQETHDASVRSAACEKSSCNRGSSKQKHGDIHRSDNQDTDREDECVPSASTSWVFSPRGWF